MMKFINWNSYFVEFLIILIIATSSFYLGKWAGNYKQNKLLKSISKLENIKETKEYKEARVYIINKITHTDRYENKKELIHIINNVLLKRFSEDIKWEDSKNNYSALMVNIYDHKKKIEYIVIKEGCDNSTFFYVHELSHIIDRHKKVSIEIKPSSILKDITEDRFLDFFKNYPNINFPSTNFIDSIIKTDKINMKTGEMSFGDYQYTNELMHRENYYLSESEIFARLSNLKYFLLENDYIFDINHSITEEILSEAFADIENYYILRDKEWNSDDILTIAYYIDWLLYSPFIDFDKLDELNSL